MSYPNTLEALPTHQWTLEEGPLPHVASEEALRHCIEHESDDSRKQRLEAYLTVYAMRQEKITEALDRRMLSSDQPTSA